MPDAKNDAAVAARKATVREQFSARFADTAKHFALQLGQWYGPDDIPFLCIAGVREYHDHPGHSGDAWELHRRSGAGRFVRLLETITKYGVQPITEYHVSLVPQVSGFVQKEVPS